jgi:hypothetical protein
MGLERFQASWKPLSPEKLFFDVLEHWTSTDIQDGAPLVGSIYGDNDFELHVIRRFKGR